METKTNRRAYTRPEIEVVPCAISAIMGPSVHADGFRWNNGGEYETNWGSGLPGGYDPNRAMSFRFKSVWDATAKELQDGDLVTVSVD